MTATAAEGQRDAGCAAQETEAAVEGTREAVPAAGKWVLAATILGSSMVFIDSSVVNVALPTIQSDLNASSAAIQWVVEAYALFLAALILVGGALGDRLGRRRIFVIGTVLFAATSIWCGLSPNSGSLISARAAQGIAGALLTPASLAIISATYPAGEARGRAIGTWSGFTAITTAGGPVLGGWLVENLSWRWIFFINVPLALGVIAIAATRVPESHDDQEGRLDVAGAALATVGLGTLVYGLILAPVEGWGDPTVVVALVIGVAALAGFVAVEAKAEAPMMPLGLFRSRTFAGANLLTLLLYAALGGAFYFFPFLLIDVQGYSATEAGAAMLPFVLLLSVLSRWSGGLIGRYGSKLPLVVGPLIAAAGFLLFARPGLGGSYWSTYFPAAVALGLGMAVTIAPLTTTVMGAVEGNRSGVASGISNAVARTASLLAIAVLGIVVATVFDRTVDNRLAEIAAPVEVTTQLDPDRFEWSATEAPDDLTGETAAQVTRALDRSFLSGFRTASVVAAIMAVGASACSWLLIEGKVANRKTDEQPALGAA